MGPVEAKAIMKNFKYKVIQVPKADGSGTENFQEKEDQFNTIVRKFTEYFIPKKNIRHERFIFQKRVQLKKVTVKKEGGVEVARKETVEEFLRALQGLVKTCEYQDAEDQVLDRFVIGLLDTDLSGRMQLKATLTLADAVRMARQQEQIDAQKEEQRASEAPAAVEELRSGWRGQNRHHRGHRGAKGGSRGGGGGRGRGQAPRPAQPAPSGAAGGCDKCGGNHASHDRCPASGRPCKYCKRMGHFAIVCHKKLRKGLREMQLQPPEQQPSPAPVYYQSAQPVYYQPAPQPSPDNYWLNTITCQDTSPPWEVDLPLGGAQVRFKIDTGADVTVIDSETYRSMPNKPPLTPTKAKLMSPGGAVGSMGEFIAATAFRGNQYTFKVIVATGPSCLLSRSVAMKMGLVVQASEVVHDDVVFGAGGLVKTDPVKIHLKEDAKPYALMTARRVPFPLLKKVEEELKRLERHGIITRVTEPSDWCSGMVPVRKKDESVRVTIDYKRLNASVKRQQFMLPNLEDIAPKLAGAKFYTVLDAACGFFQFRLDPESSMLTTFITPFGRFRFNRLPMGISCAPEIFQEKMHNLLEDHEGCEVIMDDILIYGKTEEEHDRNLAKVLATIKASGMKLNRKKCHFKKSEISYFGHVIGHDGIKASPEKVRAIQDMEPPRDVGELRTLVGMLNYLGKFTPNLSSTLKPITELLKESSAWSWGPPQQQAFLKIKQQLSELPALDYYRPERETVVSADASSYGLGGVLLQRVDQHLVPIAYCSRTLTESEKRYAQIEKECLASVWACEKFEKYLVGLPEFELLTDHKPLVPLISTKDLDQCPVRCQRLLMRLMRFNPRVRHVPGKELVIADALSRRPIPHRKEDEEKVAEIFEFIDSVRASWPTTSKYLEKIKQATARDPVLQKVASYIAGGWPKHQSAVSLPVQPYLQVQDQLSVVDGLVTHGSRLVIPESLKEDVLEKLHESHQGRGKCRERAGTSVWWPGIGQDINTVVEACSYCIENGPAQRHEPLMPTSLPGRPWEKVAADLCELNQRKYLITVDYYSRWIEIDLLGSTTSSAVIGKFKRIFATHGIPDVMMSDNGPQFSSDEFASFANEYGFAHSTSSPHMPQANGLAERAVQTAKRVLSQPNSDRALLNYRDTPHAATGVSPAEALMGRRLRTLVPVLPQNLAPQVPSSALIQERDEAHKRSYKDAYDKRHGARPLPPLQPGQEVRIRTDKQSTWRNPGQVLLADPANRTYQVATPQGVVRRNRQHLKPAPAFQLAQPLVEQPPVPAPPPAQPPIQMEAASPVVPPPAPSPQLAPAPPMPLRRSTRPIVVPLRYRDN